MWEKGSEFSCIFFSCRSSCGSHTPALDVAQRNTEAWFVAGWTVLNMKGRNNIQWIVIRRNDAEAEAAIFWPPDVKNQFIGKDSDPGKCWRQKEKGVTEDEMTGWHHWLNGHESEQTLGESGGQGRLECCSAWAHRVGYNLSNEQQQLPWRMP